GVLEGTLGQPSFITLMGAISERFPFGKLTLIRGPGSGGRAEIHFAAGHPVHIATDVPALETSELLVSCKVLEADAVEAYLHEVLREQRALAAVIAQRARIELGERRPKLTLARLEELISWTGARFAYTLHPPGGCPPIARSLYSLLFELVQRTRSTESL